MGAEEKYAAFFFYQAHHVGPLGRWAVGPLMIVTVCGVSFIAQAQPSDPYGDPKVIKGQWVVSYSIESGKGIGSTKSASKGFVFNFATTDKGYYGEYESGEDPRGGNPSYGGASVDSGGQSGRVSASGQLASAKVEGVNVKVTYKWDHLYAGPYAPGAELEKPPAKLNFFLYGGATGSAYGGATKVFASADGKDSSDTSQTYKSAGATHLFSFETKGGVEFSGTMPLKAEASGDSSASALFNFSTNIDNRSVTLSRSNASGESTTYEDGVQVTHGDTIYTYYDEKMFLPSDQRIRNVPNDLSFSGSCNGNWSLNGATNWVISDGGAFSSPGSDDFEGTYELRRTAKPGSQGLTQDASDKTAHWVGKTTPQTVTIKYFARDNSDGVEGEARYVLTLHDPIEKDHEATQSLWVYTPVWGSHAHGGDPNGVQKEYGPFAADGQNNPSVEIGHGTSRGSAQTLSGEIGFEEIGAAFGYSYEWSQEKSNDIGRSVPINIDVPANYFTYPQFEDEYLRHNVFFRHFTAAGEHKLADVEFPPGSGYYDPQFHECEFDEPKGGRVMWAPPQPEDTGHIPDFGDHIEPTPNRSGGSS